MKEENGKYSGTSNSAKYTKIIEIKMKILFFRKIIGKRKKKIKQAK